MKVLGPFPLVQLLGGIGLLYACILTLRKGQMDAKATPATISLELPDWYIRDFDQVKKDTQRSLWLIEEVNNKIELLRSQSEKSVS